jgi:hypothetical protein
MFQGVVAKMAARRQWVSLPVLLMCACGSSTETPLPSITSVEPASTPADSRFQLTVNFDGALPIELDYAQGSARVISPQRVSIADRDFASFQPGEHGRQLTLDIIPWLTVGAQDVRVQFEDGRQVVLEKGLEVQPPLNLTGFVIEPIGSQVRGQPFVVTIRAQGADAARFQGQVIVRSTQGNVNPKVTNAFNAGVLQQEFTGDNSIQSTLSIIVEDYAGHTGNSNEFLLAKP